MKIFIKYCAGLIFALSLILSHSKCNINRQDSPGRHKLLLTNSVNIAVPEPSGLAFTYDKNNLWTVSDQNSKVYLIDKKGKILKSFKINLEDIEGITVIDSSRIAVIGERSREILLLDTNGTELKRAKLPLKGRLNEGIEGVCFDSRRGNFFFANEKRPGLLIKTDSAFNILLKKEIEFAGDYSDLSYDKYDGSLWVLSDESKKFFSINESGEVISEYSIFVDQPEGIAVDVKNRKVFIVSDKREKLYEYDLP